MPMTTRVFAPALGAALLAVQPLAFADIYLCVDAQGRRELTDTSRAGCRLLERTHTPVMIAAPKARTGPAPAARAAAPAAAAAPADFPRVDTAQQRARDNDRRGILAEELRSEQLRLAELRKEFNNGEPERQGNEKNYAKYQARVAEMRDSIFRSEKNVEALQREIANIR